MENLDLKLHTVVLLVGPTNSGKSFFSKNYLIPGLEKAFKDAKGAEGQTANLPKPVIHYLSSDDIRREVLSDPTAHKYEPRMMQVSEKAFNALHQRLDSAMEWPHNAQFVVVDTTGLNEAFRKKIVAQAQKSHYNVALVIFDYKDADEYFKHVPEDTKDKRILFKHLEKLRKDVWKTVSRDTYDQIFKIRSKDFDQYPVSVQKLDTYSTLFLNPALRYDVIGDVHGCLAELKELLQKLGYKIEDGNDKYPYGMLVPPSNHGLIFVGDLIDKGPMSLETLTFVESHAHLPWFDCIWANHENFVLKYLTGKIKDVGMPEDVRKEYFSTTEEFKGNKEAIEKLTDLGHAAAPFLVHPRFMVTHAPCEAKYLGKLDSLSIKMQRGQYRVPRRSESPDNVAYVKQLEEHFGYLKTEAVHNAPLHVFGHVSFKSCMFMKNKVGIDSGCAAGGRLSAASIDFGGKVYFCHVPSKQPAKEDLVDLFKTNRDGPHIDLNELEPREYGRVMWTARDKIAFVSGTIAPAAASGDNLESLELAYDYYRAQGVKRVVLQPKYMGSRCNAYLSKVPEECFAVSRNGFRIRHVELGPVFHKLREKFKDYLEVNKLLVLDGELMPWHAMGSGLIEEQYKVVEYGLETEFDFLQDAGLPELLAKSAAEAESSGFNADKNLMPKEELYKKYGQAKGHTWRCLGDIGDLQLDERIEALAIYKEQIKIFGSPGEPEYKPFAILKALRNDGVETNFQANGMSNESQFRAVSSDIFVTVDLDNPGHLEVGRIFFESVTSSLKMEGIVMKPADITEDVAPALKVRGPNYLTLVYGYDYLFPEKHKRLIETKRVTKKMRTSMQEFKLGQKMLAYRQDEITEQNEAYLQLVAAMVLEERHEKTLDPRL